MTKLSVVYRTSQDLAFSYPYEYGFVQSAIRTGVLKSALNVANRYVSYESQPSMPQELIDGTEPIVFLNGYLSCFDWVFSRLGKDRRYVLIESESSTLIGREMSEFWNNGKDIHYEEMKSRAPFWKLVYAHSECDVPSYFGIPSKQIFGLMSMDAYHETQPATEKKVLFVGSTTTQERYDLLELKDIVQRGSTKDTGDCFLNALNLSDLISKHHFFVAPISNSKTCTFRPFLGMACRRLVFIQRNPFVTKFREIFKDFVHCRYYDTLGDLVCLQRYYIDHMNEADSIATNGYNLCKEQFDIDKFVVRLSEELEYV